MHFHIVQRASGTLTFQLALGDGSVALVGAPQRDVDACVAAIREVVTSLREGTGATRHARGGQHRHAFVGEDGNPLADTVARPGADEAVALLAELQAAAAAATQVRITFPPEQRVANAAQAEIAVAVRYDLDEPSRSGRPGLELLRRSNDRLHTAHFNDADGRALLYLRGFTSRHARDEQARALVQGLSDARRFRRQNGDDRVCFTLTARNGRELARSRWFAAWAECEEAIAWLAAAAPAAAADLEDLDAPAAPAARKSAGQAYLLDRPATTREPGFELFRADDGRHYFHLVGPDGAALLFSHGYSAPRERDAGMRAAIRSAMLREQYQRRRDGDAWFFAVLAGNSRELARSRNFTDEAELDRAIAWTIGQIATLGNQVGVRRRGTMLVPLSEALPADSTPAADTRPAAAPTHEPSADAHAQPAASTHEPTADASTQPAAAPTHAPTADAQPAAAPTHAPTADASSSPATAPTHAPTADANTQPASPPTVGEPLADANAQPGESVADASARPALNPKKVEAWLAALRTEQPAATSDDGDLPLADGDAARVITVRDRPAAPDEPAAPRPTGGAEPDERRPSVRDQDATPAETEAILAASGLPHLAPTSDRTPPASVTADEILAPPPERAALEPSTPGLAPHQPGDLPPHTASTPDADPPRAANDRDAEPPRATANDRDLAPPRPAPNDRDVAPTPARPTDEPAASAPDQPLAANDRNVTAQPDVHPTDEPTAAVSPQPDPPTTTPSIAPATPDIPAEPATREPSVRPPTTAARRTSGPLRREPSPIASSDPRGSEDDAAFLDQAFSDILSEGEPAPREHRPSAPTASSQPGAQQPAPSSQPSAPPTRPGSTPPATPSQPSAASPRPAQQSPVPLTSPLPATPAQPSAASPRPAQQSPVTLTSPLPAQQSAASPRPAQQSPVTLTSPLPAPAQQSAASPRPAQQSPVPLPATAPPAAKPATPALAPQQSSAAPSSAQQSAAPSSPSSPSAATASQQSAPATAAPQQSSAPLSADAPATAVPTKRDLPPTQPTPRASQPSLTGPSGPSPASAGPRPTLPPPRIGTASASASEPRKSTIVLPPPPKLPPTDPLAPAVSPPPTSLPTIQAAATQPADVRHPPPAQGPTPNRPLARRRPSVAEVLSASRIDELIEEAPMPPPTTPGKEVSRPLAAAREPSRPVLVAAREPSRPVLAAAQEPSRPLADETAQTAARSRETSSAHTSALSGEIASTSNPNMRLASARPLHGAPTAIVSLTSGAQSPSLLPPTSDPHPSAQSDPKLARLPSLLPETPPEPPQPTALPPLPAPSPAPSGSSSLLLYALLGLLLAALAVWRLTQ